MIMDELTEFCDATALSTVGTGLAQVGSGLDLSVARDIGNGKPVYLVITVDTAPTSGGAATTAFQLVSDASATMAADGTETLHWESQAFAIADLPVGKKIVIPLPLEDPDYERYLGIQQNVLTAALTAGAINAFLTLDPHGNKSYPEGTN